MSVTLLAGEKQYHESSKAIQACNDYLRMGPARSLRDLAKRYNETRQNTTPTRSFNTLGKWSARYDWQDRAEFYDARIEEKKNAEAEKVMQSGLALSHERVKMLKALAWDLEDKSLVIRKYHGEDVLVPKTSVINQLRGVLDDIAKETGGRIAKSEHEFTGDMDVNHRIPDRVERALEKIYGEDSE